MKFLLALILCFAGTVAKASTPSETLSEIMVDLMVSYHHDKVEDEELVQIMEIVPNFCWQIIDEDEIKIILLQEDLIPDQLKYLNTKLKLRLKNYLTDDEMNEIVLELNKNLM